MNYFSILISTSYAHNHPNYTVAPTNVETCSTSNSTFEVTVTNNTGNAITDGEISISVDPDALIQLTSAAVTQVLPTDQITTLNPITLAVGASFFFTYEVSYPCDMIQPQQDAQTLAFIDYQVTDNASFTFNNGNTTVSTSEDYFVGYANLISTSSSDPNLMSSPMVTLEVSSTDLSM